MRRFCLTETGAMTAPEDHYNWEKPELYLAKLQYINAAILRTVDNIQTHDPEAVILLQADHGARIPGHLVEQFGGPWFDTEVEIPFMENVLNCAYVPERIVDVEGETCINTTRKVLDAVFGLSLGALAVPEDYTIPRNLCRPHLRRKGEAVLGQGGSTRAATAQGGPTCAFAAWRG